MTWRRVFLCLAPLTVAACGSGGSERGETPADVPEAMSGDALAAEMKQAVRPLPGQYSSTVELVALDLPGVPAEQVGQLRSMMESAMARTNSYCLTKEEAERGFEEMARESQENCRIESFDVDGAKFAGRMSCSGEGARGTMTMNGTGSETGSQMAMAMDMQSSDLPGGSMNMKLKVVSQRTGDCQS